MTVLVDGVADGETFDDGGRPSRVGRRFGLNDEKIAGGY
jgi:hypothetical protein